MLSHTAVRDHDANNKNNDENHRVLQGPQLSQNVMDRPLGAWGKYVGDRNQFGARQRTRWQVRLRG